jgi:hypothetical protein
MAAGRDELTPGDVGFGWQDLVMVNDTWHVYLPAYPTWSLQDVGRFRIFGTPMKLMPGWCSDLKYAAALASSVWHLWRPSPAAAQQLRRSELIREQERGWGWEKGCWGWDHAASEQGLKRRVAGRR